MSKQKRERRRAAHHGADESQTETSVWRRIGAGLTLIVVCTATVLAGYYFGQYIIRGVVTDTLGDTPQVARTDVPAAAVDLPHRSGEPTASAPAGVTSSVPEAQPAARDESSTQSVPRAPIPSDQSNSTGTSDGSEPAAAPVATGPAVPEQRTQVPPAPVPAQTSGSSEEAKVLHRVQVGSFSDRARAEALLLSLSADYPDAFITTSGGDFRVQVGSFSSESGAAEVANKLRAAGHADVHIEKVQL